MRHVFVIHGFVGSGKSTLAKKIESATGALRLSADDWYLSLSGTVHQVGVDDRMEHRVHELLWELWPRAVRSGADVILDMGFWTRASRDRARALSQELGARFVLLHLVTSDKEAIRRCEVRNLSSELGFEIDEKRYWTLRSRFEPAEVGELAVKLRT